MQLINTGPEPFFEDVVDHMAAICSAPLAIVSLTGGRQWINGRHGAKGHEALPGEAGAAQAMLGRTRFVANALAQPATILDGVTVVACICVPLVMNGVEVGNLYIADTGPRMWSHFEISYMDRSSRLVAAHFEARVALAERDRRIELENRLSETGALYQAVLASMQEGVVVETEGQGILASNAAAREILGLTEDQLHGRASIDPRWQATEPDGSLMAPARLPVERAFATGKPQIGVVMGIRRPDGDHRWVRANSVPLDMPGGGPRRVATTFADITEELEQDLKLASALKAAEAASASKSAFLANMSHEIRTPLNGILGMAQALEQAALPDELGSHVSMILESGQTLMTLLNDVLDLSKIEAGKFAISPTDCDVQRVLRQQMELWTPLAEEKGLTLSLSIDIDLPRHLRFDSTRVQQGVSNFISNAVKFTERGGVEIGVSSRALAGGDHLVTVRVIDTGPGMDAATLARLFKPFTQADETISRRHGGTGLGLSITRQLAELMGGAATAVSEPGRGSTFSMSFRAGLVHAPVSTPEPVRDKPARHDARCSGDLRVLLVDDHPINRQVATIFLRACASEVITAENGVEAMAALSRDAFDVVLLDMHMPVMDGPTTIRRIRASGEAWANVPVIALTADAMAGDRERYLAMGMNGYLSKPLDARALLSEVARHARQDAGPGLLDMAS